ncbi:MAG TPA: exonuclease SbcCD subunit D [Acidimicrobiia bacterium]|nr:exonuclease SbcCD subunit D [Acidimicrobiia bacterium]
MRLLHTSDWHVGRKIRGRSRVDEHRAVLDEIVDVARDRRVDATLVAGDLFDVSSPSPEDEAIVYRALLDLAEIGPVLVVAGNHDSPARLEAVKPLLDLGRITVAARPSPPAEGGVAVVESLGLKVGMLPFVTQRGIVKAEQIMNLDPDQHAQSYEARLRRVIESLVEDMGLDTVNVVTGHLTVYGAASGGGERESHIFGYAIPPQAFPGSLSYVALGHLHRQQRIPASAPVWYSGSPLQLDFGETGDHKGVLIVDVEAGNPASVEPVALSSGIRLVQVGGTLEQVLSMSAELEDAYVKVMLDEPGRAGLNDEVRAAIPGAVEVNITRTENGEPRERVARAGRTPIELFESYLESRQVDDLAVVQLFRELEQEVMSS